MKEGGLIRDGYDAGLDELRRAGREGKDWIARLQQQEIERTGIPSLKVRFNSVFGYYIEITKANLDKVPPDYVRKQTVANGERYITPELKEMEGKILGAEERALKVEYELFLEVRGAVVAQLEPIQKTARALAQLDVLAAFAETARMYRYCRPEVKDEGVLRVREGRHPVLEQVPGGGAFCAQRCRTGLAQPADRADHRPEHGGQEHVFAAGRPVGVAGAHGLVCARQRGAASTWWTAFSRGSAPATIFPGANRRSWWK